MQRIFGRRKSRQSKFNNGAATFESLFIYAEMVDGDFQIRGKNHLENATGMTKVLIARGFRGEGSYASNIGRSGYIGKDKIKENLLEKLATL